MNKILNLIAATMIIATTTLADNSNWNGLNLEKLATAVAEVESNSNSNAVGDNGNAIGAFQLWKITVDDVNRIAKTSYSYEDRKDFEKSKEMFLIYIKHYGALRNKQGMELTYHNLARLWNGGPRGHLKSATEKYADKVTKEMGL